VTSDMQRRRKKSLTYLLTSFYMSRNKTSQWSTRPTYSPHLWTEQYYTNIPTCRNIHSCNEVVIHISCNACHHLTYKN